MTKRDYERAAALLQSCSEPAIAMEVFVRFFADDNPRFDEARFRAACVPGANMRARPRRRVA
jgi:hypothetical protein